MCFFHRKLIGNVLFLSFCNAPPSLDTNIFPLFGSFCRTFVSLSCFFCWILAYPIGALFFGYVGDKYGRRVALSFSLLGMALSTFGIGFLPSYAALGILSPLILTFLRLIQGICAGGECMGGGVFVVESISSYNLGFFGSLIAASGTFGALLASIVSVFFVSSTMPPWAWRLPFLISIFIGIVGLYLRTTVEESPSFKASFSKEKYNPLKELLAHHLIPFLCAIGVGALGTVPFYLVIGFLNSYLVFLNVITLENSATVNLILLIFCAFTIPLAGYVADKVGYARTMVFSALASLIYAYPFFHVVYVGSLVNIILAETTFLAFSQLFVAPINAFLTQLFPVRSRYTGTAFGYCVGMALFGGTTPYIALSLINGLGNAKSPFIYVMLVCLIGLMSVLFGKNYVSQTIDYKLKGSEA
ncbi:MAG: hypothetical protein BGO67_03540 [Alphaproteobacteria bacterium 41-28]|nr:MAG: hypothetical protein BGO67_03540 [Alphaproteobacteria bacterium 41-28]